MMYSLSHSALVAPPRLFGLVPALPEGSDWDFFSPDRFDAADDAMLRRLLANDDQVSDDMLGRFLASIRGERDLPFDPSIATLVRLRERPLAGTILMPDTRLVLPPPVVQRDDRPIVLRGGAPRTAPREPQVEATKSVALPMASIDEGDATDLSRALAACVTDDRARAPARRRRMVAHKSIWAAAAALASIAIVTPTAMRWRSPAAPVTVAVSSPAPMTRAAPSPVRSAATAIPATTHVAVAAPPPGPAPLPTGPVNVATVEPARDLFDEQATAAVAAVHHGAPLVVSPEPVAATPARVPLVAMRPTPVAHAAKRKAKKTTAAKGTIVASALALPDVLRPH